MKAQNTANKGDKRLAAQGMGRDHRAPRWFEAHLQMEDQLGRVIQLAENSPDQLMVDRATGKLFQVVGFSDLDPTSPDVPRP
jgi:hypothetical protein